MKKHLQVNYMDAESNALIIEIITRAMHGVPLDTPIREHGRIVPLVDQRRGMVPAPKQGDDPREDN